MTKTSILGELAFEIDSLYVSTEMILSGRFQEPPLDGLLLEAALLHFRVVWDFFYRPMNPRYKTDAVVRRYIPEWTAVDPPIRLKVIRKRLDVMLAHLTDHRLDPDYKADPPTRTDVCLIRQHTKALFTTFISAPLTKEQRDEFVNPLAFKFTRYEALTRHPEA